MIQERMNTYIDSKPLRVINNGASLVYWSERDGWGIIIFMMHLET